MNNKSVTLLKQLKTFLPESISKYIVKSFNNIEKHYYIQNPKNVVTESGPFVEGIRIALEYILFNRLIEVGSKLKSFDQSEISRLNNAAGHKQLRIVVPSLLRSVYDVRNDRFGAHLKSEDADRIDANFVLSASKQILSRMLISHGIKNKILYKKLSNIEFPLFEHINSKELVLGKELSFADKVLLVLYRHSESGRNLDEIQNTIRYSNKSVLSKQIIKGLIKNNEVICDEGKFFITNRGRLRVLNLQNIS